MTKRPSPERLAKLRDGLVCLVPKPGVAGVSSHEHSLCDCTVLELFAEIDCLQEEMKWRVGKVEIERDALRSERDLLKERLGPAGAGEIVRLKRGNEIMLSALCDIRNHSLIWKKDALENAKVLVAIHTRASEALALAKPGEDGK